jgi:hypothetical protein
MVWLWKRIREEKISLEDSTWLDEIEEELTSTPLSVSYTNVDGLS